MPNKEAIVSYYDNCENDYRLFWDLDRSFALHAGYWDETTHTLTEALERENEILALMANIGPEDRVLDAGCGIGGSSLYLARHYGCEVVGITLSAKQVETASRLAQSSPQPLPVTFRVMDFTQTSFPSESFDVVWGLESICHAPDKKAFIREAYRLLKPGGRLIVADGFLLKEGLSPQESKAMGYWLRGWGVSNLDSVDRFQYHLSAVGFEKINYRDITSNVLPSSKRLFRISLPAVALSTVGEWLGMRSKVQTANLWAAYYQYTTLKKKLWQYGIFTATKAEP